MVSSILTLNYWSDSVQKLRDLLDSLVSETSFDLGHTTTIDGGVSTSYTSSPGEVVSASQLLEMLKNNSASESDWNQARSAVLDVPLHSFVEFIDYLRSLLVDYIDPESDYIGCAIPHLGAVRTMSTTQVNHLTSTASVYSLDSFGKALVRAAAVIGSDRVTNLLYGWLEGQPVNYRTCALLNGVVLDKSLFLADGVEIEALPWSTDNLPKHLPKRSDLLVSNYLGRAVVSIGCAMSPALFRPGVGDRAKSVVVASIQSKVDIRTVCEALSLETDAPVEEAFYWNDYGELSAYSSSASIDSWSSGRARFKLLSSSWGSLTTDFRTGVSTATLDPQSIVSVSDDKLTDILGPIETSNSETRIAISRWIKSKDAGNGITDQFIDLRIALESLFLGNARQEMQFRLALHGAWYLGPNSNERQHIYQTLRDAYDQSSRAVHGQESKSTNENRKLLSDAQDLCRRGILKILNEGAPVDWGDLVLGIGFEGVPASTRPGIIERCLAALAPRRRRSRSRE